MNQPFFHGILNTKLQSIKDFNDLSKAEEIIKNTNVQNYVIT